MKKLLTFFALFMCVGTFALTAQEIIFQEDFSAATGSGTQQCESSGTYMNVPDVLAGWDGYRVYPANGKIKLGTGSAAGYIETPAIELTNGGGSFILAFDAKAWFTASEQERLKVLVNGNEIVVDGVSKGTGSEDCELVHFAIPITCAGETMTLRFENYQDANARFFLDNIVVTTNTVPYIAAAQQDRLLTNLNTTVSTQLIISGGNLSNTGNTTLAISGSSAFTLATTTLANTDIINGTTVQVDYTPTTPGNETATVTFTNSDLTEPITFTISGTCTYDVNTIAEFYTLLSTSNHTQNVADQIVYRYVGSAYVTENYGGNSGECLSKWIQDNTGAIQLYDENKIVNNIDRDFQVTNITGTLTSYKGNLELIPILPIQSTDISIIPSFVPNPLEITAAQLNDETFMDGIQNQIVILKDVEFINGVTTYETDQIYQVVNGTDTTCVRIGRDDCTLPNNLNIPAGTTNILGIVMRLSVYADGSTLPSRYYIRPISSNTSGVTENETAAISIFPNPTNNNVTIATESNVTRVEIYSVMGALVATQPIATGANTVKMSHLTNGVYFLRLYNNNQLVGTTKVVRQ